MAAMQGRIKGGIIKLTSLILLHCVDQFILDWLLNTCEIIQATTPNPTTKADQEHGHRSPLDVDLLAEYVEDHAYVDVLHHLPADGVDGQHADLGQGYAGDKRSFGRAEFFGHYHDPRQARGHGR